MALRTIFLLILSTTFVFSGDSYAQQAKFSETSKHVFVDIIPGRPIVIYAHGGAGYRDVDKSRVRMIRSLGYSTIAFDAYKLNEIHDWRTANRQLTVPQKRALIDPELKAAVRFAKVSQKVDQKNIFLYGQSNGAAAVIFVGNTEENIKGIIAEAPSVGSGDDYRGIVKTSTIMFYGKQDNWGGSFQEDFLYRRKGGLFSSSVEDWARNQINSGQKLKFILFDAAGHDFFFGNLREVPQRRIDTRFDPKMTWSIGSNESVKKQYKDHIQKFISENIRN